MASILFAEDKEDVAQLMIEILKHEGHEVQWAKNGDDAIKILDSGSQSFDIVITDILMPNKDGFDVVKYMKANDLGIPVIVMSGGGVTISSEDALRAIENDVDKVLRKPVNISELNEAIKSLLD